MNATIGPRTALPNWKKDEQQKSKEDVPPKKTSSVSNCHKNPDGVRGVVSAPAQVISRAIGAWSVRPMSPGQQE